MIRELLGTQSAAAILEVDPRMVRFYITRGKLKPRYRVRDTGAYLFTEADVRRFKAERDKINKGKKRRGPK